MAASCPDWGEVRRERQVWHGPCQNRSQRHTGCCPGADRPGDPCPCLRSSRRGCCLGVGPLDGGLAAAHRRPVPPRRRAPRVRRESPRPRARGQAWEREREPGRAQGPVPGQVLPAPRLLARVPLQRCRSWEPALPSWLPASSSPRAWPRRAAWPPEAGGRQAPPPWTRPTSRIRLALAAWRELPCLLPRALWRAHGPEPSTQLSCLGPGQGAPDRQCQRYMFMLACSWGVHPRTPDPIDR